MTLAGRAGVLGAGGFVGTSVCQELLAQGWAVVPLPAPRLRSDARDLDGVLEEGHRCHEVVSSLAERMGGLDVIVNAAGLARPGRSDRATLFGANALLPKVVADACTRAHVGRLVHVSSAAVQGDRVPLDETPRYWADSPYARSKALGEQAVLASFLGPGGARAVVLRPTSVHGPRRALTRHLVRVARSPLASVVAGGAGATPQVLVGNVGAAAAHLCSPASSPPAIVLQPWEGWSAAGFLQLLSGRRPHDIPTILGTPVLSLARLLSPRGSLTTYRRRLELLWLGQAQVTGWLPENGFIPRYGRTEWEQMLGQLVHVGAP